VNSYFKLFDNVTPWHNSAADSVINLLNLSTSR